MDQWTYLYHALFSVTNVKVENATSIPQGDHHAKSSKPHQSNYRVHFIHLRKFSYKMWIYHSLQFMFATSLYVRWSIGKTSTLFQ